MFVPSSLGSYRHGLQAARRQFLAHSHVGEQLSVRVLSGSTRGVDFAHHIFQAGASALSQPPAAAFLADDAYGPRRPTQFANSSRAHGPEQRLSTPLQRLRISMSAPVLAPAEPAAGGAWAEAGGAPAAAVPRSTVTPLRSRSPPPSTPALFRPHSTRAAPPLDSLETFGKCALASSQWHEVHAASLTAEALHALREMRCADGSPLWAGMEEEEILAALEAGQLRCCPRYAVLMREGSRAEAAFAILEGEVRLLPPVS